MKDFLNNPQIVGACVFVITSIGAAIVRRIEKGRDKRKTNRPFESEPK